MARLSSLFIAGASHLAVLVAIMATLATAFGIHAHTDACGHHEVVGKFSTDVAADHLDEHGADADPDGCGHCHCSSSAADLPATQADTASIAAVSTSWEAADQAIPDGLTFQPDPPPLRG